MASWRKRPLIPVLWTALAGMVLLPAMTWAQAAKPALACMECHGSVPKYPILGARLGYDYSGHKNNGNSRYANGGGCQRCHTNEGFIDYLAKGSVDPNAFIDYPSQPGCCARWLPSSSPRAR